MSRLKTMFFILIVFIMHSCENSESPKNTTPTIKTYQSIQILNNIDFDTGEYILIGFPDYFETEILDSIGSFYISDKEILKSIKDEWVVTNEPCSNPCGYDYTIKICKGGKSIKEMYFNFSCHGLVNTEYNGKPINICFDFEKLLMKYKKHFKIPKVKKIEKLKYKDCKNKILQFYKDSNLLYAPTPHKFEGHFQFVYYARYIKNNRPYQTFIDSVYTVIKKDIHQNYPNEEFELSDLGGGEKEIYVGIYCNKSLENKFSLYERWNKIGEWKPHDCECIETYWK